MPVTSATIEGAEVEYNLTMANDGSTNVTVNPVMTLSASTKGLKVRMVAVSNVRAQNEALIPTINGGTCRIAGAEGTSPVIKVIN